MEVDFEMMDEFNEAADQLFDRAVTSKDWGTEDSQREYRTRSPLNNGTEGALNLARLTAFCPLSVPAGQERVDVPL